MNAVSKWQLLHAWLLLHSQLSCFGHILKLDIQLTLVELNLRVMYQMCRMLNPVTFHLIREMAASLCLDMPCVVSST